MHILASCHRQAAIYAYRVKDGVLIREVVWVDAKKNKTHGTSEQMERADPGDAKLAAKVWVPP